MCFSKFLAIHHSLNTRLHTFAKLFSFNHFESGALMNRVFCKVFPEENKIVLSREIFGRLRHMLSLYGLNILMLFQCKFLYWATLLIIFEKFLVTYTYAFASNVQTFSTFEYKLYLKHLCYAECVHQKDYRRLYSCFMAKHSTVRLFTMTSIQI